MRPYTLLLSPGQPLPPDLPVEVLAGGQAQVTLTDEAAAALSQQLGIRLRPAWLAAPKAVRTEGYDTIFSAGDWHEAGWRGRGVTIAILDVGFAGAPDLLGEELPEDVSSYGDLGSSTHGSAVAEIIHDIAPDASLLLLSFSTDTEFLAALDAAVDAGADIINASIGFDNVWPADGTSPVSAAVTELVSKHGVLWVAAAGNEGLRYQRGLLTREGDTILLDGQTSLALKGNRPSLRLRWSEPMGSASIDLWVQLTDADGQDCGRSETIQDGDDDPTESVTATCDGESVYATISAPPGVDVDGLTAWLYAPQGWLDVVPTDATLTLPADAKGAIAVGACSLSEGAPGYSSRGPTEDGRPKPALCAPHGVSTASLGQGGLSGTSAAAPHVAGLLALMLEAEGLTGRQNAVSALQTRAIDLGDTGNDTAHGAGMVQAGPPNVRPCGCRTSAGAGSWLVLLGIGLTRRKRVR